MPFVFPSALSVSRFDGRKLLVIMIIVAVTLTVESQIGIISLILFPNNWLPVRESWHSLAFGLSSQ